MLPAGALKLAQEVIGSGECTGCGLCLCRCPYFQSFQEHIAMVYPCEHQDAVCYFCCPRTATDLEELDRHVFGSRRQDHLLGEHKAIYRARASYTQGSKKVQYGGVVTALVQYVLAQGLAAAALLTGGSPLGPEPLLARTPQEVLAAAGSKYTAVPTLQALNTVARADINQIVAVGRPCQIIALRKMQLLGKGNGVELVASRVSLNIGLFCFWALAPGIYDWLRQHLGDLKVEKLDIPPGKLEAITAEKSFSFDLEEVRPFIRRSCDSCFDPTSELADIAVGAIEGTAGWNTLIVRTLEGEEIVQGAVDTGAIELSDYDPRQLEQLEAAVVNKKRRVLAGNKAGYLHLPDDYLRAARGGEC